ncbi:amino acid/polyamine/organocation transporter, APC superfamily (TC 2.A.3) [Alkalibacterium subtropicum]|uniref:Amino acid/polyamine/organocation transporter, APC superfamily (TC 2.A.3) n=1 Tax=Alkalibacterium subtropicum TaxID=753702 RepID=A0A1I1IH99_9LACT|nr:APC family permease [Alkalibacterium subtropicum]SFC33133.1 amino acid/polyamine/organocation transporter, APC superfamily (TC 2.A.3) [Alkalibacterium subtropicum]
MEEKIGENIIAEENVAKVSLFKMVTFTVTGIVVLDTFVAPAALGASSITVWLLTAILFFIPYGLINAELGATYPEDGGIYAWVNRAFGPFQASLVAWYYWVNVAFWMPAVFIAFSAWFSMAYIPAMSNFAAAALAVAMCWLIVFIGIRGVDLSITVTNIAAILKVSVLIVFGIMGVMYAFQNGLANDFSLSSFALNLNFDTIAYSSAIVYNLLGFELISAIASKVDKPEKNIPKMTIFAGILIAAMYIIGTFGVLAAIPAASVDPLDGFFYALEELSTVFGPASGVVFNVTMIVALFTLVSNMISWTLGGVEVLDEAEFTKHTKILGHRNKKFNTPDYSYILMGIISTLLIVLNFALSGSANDAFWTILSFSFLIFFLPYLWLFPTVVKLRKVDKDIARPYEIPFGKFGLYFSSIIGFLFIALGIVLLFFTGEGWDPLYHLTLIIGTLLTTLYGVYLYRKSV